MKRPMYFSFDPSLQPGYRSRVSGVNISKYFGDMVVSPIQPSEPCAQPISGIPQGLQSYQLPQVFPSRRRVR